MSEPATFVDLRKHPRAQLQLPARIRWQGPLGMRLEVTQTVDVSRDGMLFRRNEPCERLARVWVAFPFDPAAGGSTQPETPARIVRVEPDASGGYWVALRFESATRTGSSPLTESAETRNAFRSRCRFSSAPPELRGPKNS